MRTSLAGRSRQRSIDHRRITQPRYRWAARVSTVYEARRISRCASPGCVAGWPSRQDSKVATRAGRRPDTGAAPRLVEAPRSGQGRTMRRCALVLVHHPVLDGQGAIVTTAVTNLDVHDLSRSARTYDCSDYFIAHPIAAQRALVERIRTHWTDGSSGHRIPDRREALRLLRILAS